VNLVRRVENLELLRRRSLPGPPVPLDTPADVLTILAEQARAGTGVTVWAEPVDESWQPTAKQKRELDAWDAPKLWVELANKRVAGFHRPIVRRLVGSALGTWAAAWDQFCTEHVGVSGEVTMKAHVPTVAEEIEEVRAKHPDVQPRDEYRVKHLEVLVEGWGKRFG
jgi:hypothetical protein